MGIFSWLSKKKKPIAAAALAAAIAGGGFAAGKATASNHEVLKGTACQSAPARTSGKTKQNELTTRIKERNQNTYDLIMEGHNGLKTLNKATDAIISYRTAGQGVTSKKEIEILKAELEQKISQLEQLSNSIDKNDPLQKKIKSAIAGANESLTRLGELSK